MKPRRQHVLRPSHIARRALLQPLENRLLLSGAPTQLVFLQPPTDTYVNRNMLPPVIAAVEDAGGNVVNSINSAATLEVHYTDADNTLGAIFSSVFNGGIASFTNITFPISSAWRAKAIDSADGLSSAFSNTFNSNNIPSTTTISTFNSPIQNGLPFTETAHVALIDGTVPTGAVNFSISGVPPTTVNLDGAGNATLFVSSALATTSGSHNFTATYVPDNFFMLASGATPQNLVINNVTSTITFTNISNSVQYGQNIVESVHVALSNSTVAAGTVIFTLEGVNTYPATIDGSGNAFLNTTSLQIRYPGLTVRASYSPSLNEVDGNSATPFTLAINPAPLTVTGITASDKTYDGTTGAIVNTSSAVLSGFLGRDAAEVILSATSAVGTFASKSAGSNLTVTVTGLQLAGPFNASSSYYIVNPTAAASILPRTLTPAITAWSKYYDGNNTAAINARFFAFLIGVAAVNGVNADGTISGDNVSLAGGIATFADANAGLNKIVTASGFSLAGANAANYTLNQDPANTTTATASIVVNHAPPITTNVTSTALSPTSIKTTWTLTGNTESSFYIMRWNGSAWVNIATIAAGSSSYTDTNLKPSTTYVYDIVAANAFGSTWAANYASATTPAQPAPGATTNLAANALSTTSIKINWSLAQPVSDTGVYVLRWNGTAWMLIATLAAGSTTYTDTKLTPATTYLYDIADFNSGGATVATAYCSGTTQAVQSIPTAPPNPATKITATVQVTHTVLINWTLNGGGETTVYVTKWNGTAWQFIAQLPAGSTNFTDTSPVAGTNYYLVVTANNLGMTWASIYASAIL